MTTETVRLIAGFLVFAMIITSLAIAHARRADDMVRAMTSCGAGQVAVPYYYQSGYQCLERRPPYYAAK